MHLRKFPGSPVLRTWRDPEFILKLELRSLFSQKKKKKKNQDICIYNNKKSVNRKMHILFIFIYIYMKHFKRDLRIKQLIYREGLYNTSRLN